MIEPNPTITPAQAWNEWRPVVLIAFIILGIGVINQQIAFWLGLIVLLIILFSKNAQSMIKGQQFSGMPTQGAA